MKGQKLLAGLISVIMILGTMVMPAFAADVAISDGADFKSALISGNTITLNDDITCNGSDWGIMNDISDLTINGNGHTITFSGAIDNGGNGEGMIQRSSGLNVSNLTIEFPNDDTSSSAFNYVSNSTFDNVTIKNGRFGILNEQGVKIKNCNFINQSWISIYSDDTGNTSGTEIKNCTFTDSRAYIARSDEVITGNVVTLVDTSDINALTVAPSAEATISGNLLPEGAKLELFESDSTIENNAFLGGFDTSVSENELNDVKNNNLTTASDAVAELNGVPYANLADAYAAATDENTIYTIKFFKDTNIDNRSFLGKKFIFDLNGHKLTMNASDAASVNVDKDLTFKSSAEEKGIIDLTGANVGSGIWKLADGVTITFDNVELSGVVVCTGCGTIYCEPSVTANVIFNNSKVNLSVGSLSNNNGRLTTNTDTTINDTEITLDQFDGGFAASGNVTVNGTSEITVKNGNHALSKAKLTMNDSSSLTAKNCQEGGIKLDSGSEIILNDSSKIYMSGNAGDIIYRNGLSDEEKQNVRISVAKDATFDAKLADDVAENATVTGKAAAVSIEFKETAKANEYKIVLSTPADYIHEFTAAQLKFAKGNDDIGYTIEGTNSKINVIPQGNDVYLFSLKSGESFIGDESEVVIGKVVFEGYSDSSVDFKINENYENKVEATKGQNITETFTVANDKLIINNGDDGKIDVSFEEPKCDVTINVDMYLNVTDNAAVYQDMKIVVTGQELDNPITYALGTDGIVLDGNSYSKTVTLKQNNTYVITVSGAGYRTAQYILKIKENDTATVNFWNNVQRTGALVSGKIGDSETTAWHNFIAGDIIKDNKLDIFDLSAVVAYFGDEATDAERTTDGWAKAKYDLNRDGKIDADDVSIVLNAWKGLELLNN